MNQIHLNFLDKILDIVQHSFFFLILDYQQNSLSNHYHLLLNHSLPISMVNCRIITYY